MRVKRAAAARALRASFREFWPELACAALLSVFLLVRAPDGPVFVGFVAVVLAIGWAMGHRHRERPMHRKIDALVDGFREFAARDARARESSQGDSQQPRLRLVHGRKH